MSQPTPPTPDDDDDPGFQFHVTGDPVLMLALLGTLAFVIVFCVAGAAFILRGPWW